MSAVSLHPDENEEIQSCQPFPDPNPEHMSVEEEEEQVSMLH